MIDIKEQTYGRNWGSDAAGIRYPSVSSCVTLTYYYKDLPLLVGVHFGMFNANKQLLSGKEMDSILAFMMRNAPRDQAPTKAFMIGSLGWWDANLIARLDVHSSNLVPGGLDDVVKRDIPDDYLSSDIEIYTCGLWSVQSNVVPKLHSGRFQARKKLRAPV